MKKLFKIVLICGLCFSIVGCSKKDIAENQEEANKIIDAAYRVKKDSSNEPQNENSVYDTRKSGFWFFICNDAYIDVHLVHNSIDDTEEIDGITYHDKDFNVIAPIYGDGKSKDEKSTEALNDWLEDTGITKEQFIKWAEMTVEKKFAEANERVLDE